MSTSDKSKIKQILFDAVFFSYSAAILVFSVWLGSSHFGLARLSLDQDYFVAQLPTLGLIGLALFFIMMGLAWTISQRRIRTLGSMLFGDATTYEHQPFLRSFHGVHLSSIFLLTFYVSLWVTQVSFSELLDQEGLSGAARLWLGLADPQWSLLPRAIIEAIETIFIAFLATVLAVPIAFMLAFFAAKNLMRSPSSMVLYTIIRLGLNLSRSIEPLVWALIFTVWVGVGPFAGMLALFLHSVASLIKYYSEVIEGISDGPVEAIRSTGANAIQIVWFGVVPQIVLPYIAMTLYRWDTNVRMATVIGLVGGGGIGTLLITYQGQAMWREVGCIILVIAVIVWLMDTASALIREALK